MTFEEFLERLRNSPRDWYLDGGRKIRRKESRNENASQWLCPLTQVLPTMKDYWAAKFDCSIIVWSADGDAKGDPEVRKKLLKACGL